MTDDPAHDQRSKLWRARKRAMGAALRGSDLKLVVGKNTYRMHHELDVTQESMAQHVGITASFIGSVERRKRNITLASLSSLAAAYGVNAHALVYGGECGVASSDGFTLDVLARYAAGLNARAQELTLHHGPVAVGRTTAASLVSALFEADAGSGKTTNLTSEAKLRSIIKRRCSKNHTTLR